MHAPVNPIDRHTPDSTLTTPTVITCDAPTTMKTEQTQSRMDLTAYTELSERKRTEIGVNASKRAQEFVGKSHINHPPNVKTRRPSWLMRTIKKVITAKSENKGMTYCITLGSHME